MIDIPDSIWQNSQVRSVFSLLPGELGLFISSTDPAALSRFEVLLPTISWRWFFLRGNAIELSSYQQAEVYRQSEDWPSQGEFFLEPTLSFSTENKVRISLSVEFLSLIEQPLIQDLFTLAQGGGLPNRHFDPAYRSLMMAIGPKLSAQRSSLTEEVAWDLIGQFVTATLTDWWQNSPIFSRSWKLSAWLDFWRQQLVATAGEDGLNTDTLLDEFVSFTRRNESQYGLSGSQIRELELGHVAFASDDELQIRAQQHYLFWLEFNQYLQIPLSLYSRILCPYFQNRELFAQDVQTSLEESYQDIHQLYSPATFVVASASATERIKKIYATDTS